MKLLYIFVTFIYSMESYWHDMVTLILLSVYFINHLITYYIYLIYYLNSRYTSGENTFGYISPPNLKCIEVSPGVAYLVIRPF